MVFSFVYGFFGAGYVALWAWMGSAVSEEPATAIATFSLFCFGKGVRYGVTGPISSPLIRKAIVLRSYGAVRYKSIILFTGTCMLGSEVSVGTCWAIPK